LYNTYGSGRHGKKKGKRTLQPKQYEGEKRGRSRRNKGEKGGKKGGREKGRDLLCRTNYIGARKGEIREGGGLTESYGEGEGKKRDGQ